MIPTETDPTVPWEFSCELVFVPFDLIDLTWAPHPMRTFFCGTVQVWGPPTKADLQTRIAPASSRFVQVKEAELLALDPAWTIDTTREPFMDLYRFMRPMTTAERAGLPPAPVQVVQSRPVQTSWMQRLAHKLRPVAGPVLTTA